MGILDAKIRLSQATISAAKLCIPAGKVVLSINLGNMNYSQ